MAGTREGWQQSEYDRDRESAKFYFQCAQKLHGGIIDPYHDGKYSADWTFSEIRQKALIKYEKAIQFLLNIPNSHKTDKDKAKLADYYCEMADAYSLLKLDVLAKHAREKAKEFKKFKDAIDEISESIPAQQQMIEPELGWEFGTELQLEFESELESKLGSESESKSEGELSSNKRKLSGVGSDFTLHPPLKRARSKDDPAAASSHAPTASGRKPTQ